MTNPPLTAADVMTPQPPTVGMDDSARQVGQAFERHQCDHLVVLDEGRVIGVLAQSDLLRALSPHLSTPSETQRDLATLSKRAHQVMTHHPVVATPDTPVGELVDAFRTRTIGCIPIIDEDRALLGLVTVRSLLFAVYSPT